MGARNVVILIAAYGLLVIKTHRKLLKIFLVTSLCFPVYLASKSKFDILVEIVASSSIGSVYLLVTIIIIIVITTVIDIRRIK